MTTQRQASTDGPTKNAAATAVDTVKHDLHSFKGFVQKFYRDWSLHLTQALTFALVSSLIPLGMLLLAVVGDIIGSLNGTAQTKFIDQMLSILPPPLTGSSQEILKSSLQKLPQSSLLLWIVGILTAIFFGSRLFTLLEACFDFIYHVPQRPFKQKNGLAILMLLLFMVLTPILVLTSLIPGQILAWLQNTSFNPHSATIQNLVGIISSLIVSFLLFEIIYTVIPNRKGSWRWKLRTSINGAITAAVVLQIALVIFPIYAHFFSKGLAGQIALVLILLIFFYIIALITLIGATVNAYYAEDIPPPSRDMVTRASQSK